MLHFHKLDIYQRAIEFLTVANRIRGQGHGHDRFIEEREQVRKSACSGTPTVDSLVREALRSLPRPQEPQQSSPGIRGR